MKKKFRVIISAFAISFVIMAGLSIYSLKQFGALRDYSNQVDHTNRVITQLYRLESLLKELDIKERGYMLTHDSTYILEMLAASRHIQPILDNVKVLTRDNEVQKKTFVLLKSTIALRLSDIKDNLKYVDTTKNPGVSPYYFQGRERKLESINFIAEMLKREDKMLREKFQGKRYYQQIASNTLIYLLIVFGLVTQALFLLMVKELKIRLSAQDELQTKLADLSRSHAELEQIAFAASHDLQEPLRKIRIFSNRLLLLKDSNNPEMKDTVDRISASAERMQELIDDMVNLTSLIKEEGEKEEVDLNGTVKNVLLELDERIKNQKAVIHREVLPELYGYPRQFHILFKSLLDNSLKFTRDEVIPVIAIRADKTTGEELTHIHKDLAQKSFYRITISDNGIGFDNKFISKMFKIFQRLHTQQSEFEGKGIGLAICQRIMVNHEGYIIANGHPDVGATFKLFFPAS
ncbi:sensor histidine kinase [Polluticoccus soli]|uniref:sensor histidine kinase n=1 Tax=Polluticoccus soli TaxID=3034150 RepID=UPI0023E2628E|nr:sensor histidine kinase [Flavipsychrobacter sp. JY13-12]